MWEQLPAWLPCCLSSATLVILGGPLLQDSGSPQDKEAERERNRRAMEEAAARKARKQQEKERKRQRQEGLAREAAAAAARAAEAAQAAAAAAAAVADDAAATAAASDSDSADPAGGEAGSAASATAPAAAATLEQRKKGGAAGSKKQARPPARRLAPAKQRGLVQQARKAAKEYSVLLVLGLVALLMLAIFTVRQRGSPLLGWLVVPGWVWAGPPRESVRQRALHPDSIILPANMRGILPSPWVPCSSSGPPALCRSERTRGWWASAQSLRALCPTPRPLPAAAERLWERQRLTTFCFYPAIRMALPLRRCQLTTTP